MHLAVQSHHAQPAANKMIAQAEMEVAWLHSQTLSMSER